MVAVDRSDDFNGEMGFIPYYHRIVPNKVYGQGICEMLNGEQNALNYEARLFYRMESLSLAPMFAARGVEVDKIQLEPNYVIRLGSDPNSEFSVVDIKTQGMDNFLSNSAARRALMYNRVGAYDSASTATAGIPGFSKTDRGVAAQQTRLGHNDEAVKEGLDWTVGKVMERLAQLYVGMRSGTETIEVDQETFNKIALYDPTMVVPLRAEAKEPQPYQIKIPWGKIKKEDIKSVTTKFDSDWMIDQVEMAKTLSELQDRYSKDPKYDSIINAREHLTAIYKGLRLDTSKLLIPRGSRPEQQPVTPEVAKAIAIEEAQQLISRQASYSSLKPESMTFDGARAIQAEMELPAEGGLPAEIEAQQKDRELDIKQQEIDLKRIELGIKQAEAGTEPTATQPAEQPAEQPVAEPANKEAADNKLAVLKSLQDSGATEEDIFEANQILMAVENGVIDKAEAEKLIKAIRDRLGGASE